MSKVSEHIVVRGPGVVHESQWVAGIAEPQESVHCEEVAGSRGPGWTARRNSAAPTRLGVET